MIKLNNLLKLIVLCMVGVGGLGINIGIWTGYVKEFGEGLALSAGVLVLTAIVQTVGVFIISRRKKCTHSERMRQ